MKKAALLVLLGLISVIAAGCMLSYPRLGPPSPREESMMGRPGAGHVWISGYWRWSAGHYSWHSGYWVRAKAGRAWVPGQWEQRGHKWAWRRGHWR
jgi:hypothetical protein